MSCPSTWKNDPRSGKEVAAMLCNMSQEKLLEVVRTKEGTSEKLQAKTKDLFFSFF